MKNSWYRTWNALLKKVFGYWNDIFSKIRKWGKLSTFNKNISYFAQLIMVLILIVIIIPIVSTIATFKFIYN